jgi:hypothetical protein
VPLSYYTDAVDSQQPVFVDASGRRRSMARKAGLLLGALLIGYAIMLGISLGTGANVPMTTWVAPDKHKPVKTDAEANKEEKRKSPVLRNSAPSVVVPVAPTRITAPSPSASGSASAKPSATKSVAPVATVTPAVTPAAEAPVPAGTPTTTPRGKKPTAPPGKNKNDE